MEQEHIHNWLPFYFTHTNTSAVTDLADYKLSKVYCHGCKKVEWTSSAE